MKKVIGRGLLLLLLCALARNIWNIVYLFDVFLDIKLNKSENKLYWCFPHRSSSEKQSQNLLNDILKKFFNLSFWLCNSDEDLWPKHQWNLFPDCFGLMSRKTGQTCKGMWLNQFDGFPFWLKKSHHSKGESSLISWLYESSTTLQREMWRVWENGFGIIYLPHQKRNFLFISDGVLWTW